MAESKSTCSVPGCGSVGRLTRGMCNLHYLRFRRHGDPEKSLIKTTPRGEVTRFLEEVVFPCESEECLLWPYTKADGRGFARYAGKWQPAYRLACEMRHGPPPTTKHEAAHSCGNGHLGCVNPRHLRWATHIENEADKIGHGTSQHGTRNHQAKLTDDTVRQIRAAQGKASQAEIGAMFGVSQTLVGLIHRRQRWGWLQD